MKRTPEQDRARRARRKAAGNPIKSKPKVWADRSEAYKERKRQKHCKVEPRSAIAPKGDDSLFATGTFVALDGEGCDFGEWRSRRLRALMPRLDLKPSGKPKDAGEIDQRYYKFREHRLFLFAASTGHECSCSNGRLELTQCLDVIFHARDAVIAGGGRPIFVWFSGGYDLAHMLFFEIGERNLARLKAGRIVAWEHDGRQFKFLRRTKSEFTVWMEGNISGWVSVTIWDVFGYFKCPFVKAVEEWLGEDADALEFVRDMKAKRGEFDSEDIDTLRSYNDCELRLLVAMMNTLRDSVAGLGIRLRRWDGAGSIAGMMLERAKIKPHIGPPLLDRVLDAARRAYFGGRIECCQIGSTGLPVWRADMNSAFPWAVAELPSLGSGEWTVGEGNSPVFPAEFTLCRVSWEFPDNAPWYPFLYRIGRSVFAPRCGEGWHWAPEVVAAEQWTYRFGGTIKVIERLSHSVSSVRPFRDLVNANYDLRSQSKSDGERKIIKLGLNAIWGKLSQQKGWRAVDGEIQTPPYHNFALAGYVTARVHARLIDFALKDPEAVIAFAVDGLLMSREPYAAPSGRLGGWRIEEHRGLTHVQSGIYWLHDGAELRKLRGIGNAELTRERILEQWRGGSRQFQLSVRRFLGIDASLMSKAAWRDRGSFIRYGEWFATDGRSSGRASVTQAELRTLHRKLVATHPWSLYGAALASIPSEPYPAEWDETDIGEDVDV